MKKFISLLAATCAFFAKGQDVYYLNTNQSLVYLNPSFAGSNGGIRNQTSYRNQWPNLSGNYVTYQNSFDAYIKPLHAGIAVSALLDDAAHGSFKSRTYSLTYAQHLSFAEGNLKIIPSIQASYISEMIDRDVLHYGYTLNPRYGITWNNPAAAPVSSKYYFGFTGGLLANYKEKLYVGASLFNFNRPDIGLLSAERVPARFSVHASYNMNVREHTHIQAFCRYNYQSIYSYGQLGLNAIFKNHFIAGIGYMTNTTVIANLGFRTGWFTLQGGYDISINNGHFGAGSWEVHASLNFPDKEKYTAHPTFENY